MPSHHHAQTIEALQFSFCWSRNRFIFTIPPMESRFGWYAGGNMLVESSWESMRDHTVDG